MIRKKPEEVLREARTAAGFKTAAEAAEHFGWTTSTYVSHENGTRKLTRSARRYARAFGISEGALLGLGGADEADGGVRSIQVIGEAAVGLWRDSAFREDGALFGTDDRRLKLPDDGGGKRFAVLAIDNSANRIIPEGEYAICRPVEDEELHDIAAGKFVVVERTRSTLNERSIRRVKQNDGGRIELETFSTEGRYRETVTVPAIKPGEKIDVVGIVVGRYADFEE